MTLSEISSFTPPGLLISLVGAEIAYALAEQHKLTPDVEVRTTKIRSWPNSFPSKICIPTGREESPMLTFEMTTVTDGTYAFAVGYLPGWCVLVAER